MFAAPLGGCVALVLTLCGSLACGRDKNEAVPEVPSVDIAQPGAGEPAPPAATQPFAPEEEAPIKLAESVETIPWTDAGKFLDREVFAVGRVVRTGRSKTGHVFLNFDRQDKGSLTIFIHKDNVKNFPKNPGAAYRDTLVRVHGFVYDHQGTPNISASGPGDIAVLPDSTPLPAPVAASSPAESAPATWTLPADGTITLGTYNTLNLFDNWDDPYSADAATDAKPRAQVEALARSIRTLNADVLALEEVENRGYLQRFNRAFLRDMGYEVVEFEGNDNRGIDVALLSRLPVGPVTSHRHLVFADGAGRPMRLRRDLLEVRLEPPGALPFEVFVVHLKSKGGEENGGADTRIGEARLIRKVLTERLAADPRACFVICGDFNDSIESEPVKIIIGEGDAALKTFVADLPADGRISFNQPPFLSMIDFVFASPAMAGHYAAGSYRIVGGGSPEATGSDHNPVVMKFRIK
jgi:endonuclease/exonuclease/phosphatase family metal-dependent hydrolase